MIGYGSKVFERLRPRHWVKFCEVACASPISNVSACYLSEICLLEEVVVDVIRSSAYIIVTEPRVARW